MKRKTNTTPSRIWKFGLPFGPERECAEAVDAQFRAGRAYANQLTEIELRRRTEYRAARSQLVPGVAAAEAAMITATTAVEEALKRISDARAMLKSRVDSAEHVVWLKFAKATRKVASAALKQQRLLAADCAELTAEGVVINARAVEAVKAARAATTVYWGTGGMIDQAASAQRASKTDPVFRRWNGEGRIGVHMQPVVNRDAIVGGACTMVRVSQPCPRGRCVLSLRIGSEGRAPIWATFKMVLHRPLPPSAMINDAWVQRSRIGTRWRWEVCFSMRAEEFVSPARLPSHACGIDVGWRKLPSGDTRAAVLVGTDGIVEEITVPKVILDKLDHVESLRSIRDRNFDAANIAMQSAVAREGVPDWLREATEHLPLWKSTARLSDVVWRWGKQRYAGDDVDFAVLEGWRKQDRHLLQWEASERDRALGRRREHYRVTAARIAERYSTIKIEDLDLRDFQRLSEPGEDKHGQEKPQRGQRTRVALSEFVAALKLAAANHGAALVKVPAPQTTSRCHVCGGPCEFDRAELIHACEHCGAEWDQDENAARNILASTDVSPKAGGSLVDNGSRENDSGSSDTAAADAREAAE